MKDNIKVNIKNTRKIIRKTDKNRYQRLKDNRYIPIIDMISKYVNKESELLDVGIREGALLDALKERGFTKLSGIDVYEVGVQAANDRGFDCQVGDAENFDLKKKFSTITISHVLEHCPSPTKVIDCIYKHLEPGGILYVEVPKQEKEPVPTVHAHYYCFDSIEDLLSFFEASQWEVLEKKEIPAKKNPKRGNLKLLIKRR